MPTQRPPTPPSGDPRTSTILFLFEEFVPQEYRDQLANPKKKGIFAPSNLFVSKSKQWKPAPTLNGKPYVVGNIPNPPTNRDREADFENMLKSSNATTKVSLTRGISTRDHPIPTPLTAHPPSESEIPPVPALPLASPMKTKNRFKLGRKRSGGIQPAEYDEMDFETREASDSDSLSDSGRLKSNGVGHNKRLSKDDAWIDILVADSSRRRVPGQDAEMGNNRRRHISSNRSDPELAREEMAKALAGVPPPDDDLYFNEQRTPTLDHGQRKGGPIHVEERLPDPEPYPYSNPIRGRRSMESDEYTQNEGPSIRVQSPSIASRNEQKWGVHHARESMDSQDFEPLPQTLSQEVEIPSFIDAERNYSQERIPPQPTSATLPPSPSMQQQSSLPETSAGGSPSSAGKKANVSTLIDMFQQKAAPAPSKLPVRTASLENPKTTNNTTAPSAPKPIPAPDPDPESITAAPLDLLAGRNSPGRYVHGAPLHNVMEEEEEDN
jgi:hypothetical protein